jgi:hypothetical protein
MINIFIHKVVVSKTKKGGYKGVSKKNRKQLIRTQLLS